MIITENNVAKEKEPAPFPLEFSERYRAVECLSHNEISETYLVKSLENGSTYVAKIYERFFAEGGTDERKILAELNHPAVPKLIDSIETAEHIYVIREYIEGQTLEKVQIPVGERFALNVGVQLCDILTYLHTQTPPIIHRDIKPQNVIIDGENKISLIDFGIARRYSDTQEKDTHLVASDGYSPPEQYGYKQTDSLSDIYSLGIMLCWILTGSSDILETENLNNRALARVVQKCAAFDPKNRYKTAESVKTALLRACNKNKYWKAAALSAAVVLMLAGSFILGRITAPNVGRVYLAQCAIAPQAQENTPHVYENETLNETPDPEPPIIQETVIFKEPLIEAAVRLILDLDDGEEITTTQLHLIRDINIDSNRIFKDSDDYHQNYFDRGYSLVQSAPITSLEDLELMPYLDTVRIQNQHIEDIEPLFGLHYLSNLSLADNPITDFSPLEYLQNLHDVDISSTLINDISPFYNLPKLRRLILNNSPYFDGEQLSGLKSVQDLSVSQHNDAHKYLPNIPLTHLHLTDSDFDSLDWVLHLKENLEFLAVFNTDLVNLSGIEEFTKLSILKIHHCNIRDLTPLLSLPNLREIEVDESMRGAVEMIEGTAGFEIIFVGQSKEPISFKEPLIEAAVRYMLDLDENEEITEEQLHLIREIHIESNRIFKDIADYHQNHADQNYNVVLKPPITSLEDLKLMPNLDTVRIGFQDITNIEPLSELTHLRVLEFLHNPVSDFSPLQSLNYLHSVNITSAPITDLSPFYELPNLEILVLNGCTQYEPSQLLSLPGNVKSLHILGHPEAYKYLPDNQFFSLTLCNSDFDSLEYISSFKSSLRDLWIYNTKLTSLDGIEEFTSLEVLSMTQTGISDLSPLLSLPNLRYVEVSESMRGAVEAIEEAAGFEVRFGG
ncbi:MAG: serine/threonine protein kinase [Oscillospiraceae bacterium]|nr:serine/threonine protein kinase [Oscillospiraceae bacterium]